MMKAKMKSSKPGGREKMPAKTAWLIRQTYLAHHCEWGPMVLMHWCEREGLGHFSPTTIAKVIADLVPVKPKKPQPKCYEIVYPMVMWSEDATKFRQEGGKQELMVAQDECARFKLSGVLCDGAVSEQDVLRNLRSAFEKYGAPLVLKHDNIAYQNTPAMHALCEKYGVVLVTSPPGYPEYNGKTERSMRDIKSYERALRRDGVNGPLADRLLMALHDLNEERPRPVLKGRTAREVLEYRSGQLPNRQRFKLEVQTKQMELQADAKNKQEKNSARRKAVEHVLLVYELLKWKGDMSTNLCAQNRT
jgi:transposase InsO family protein